MIAKYNLITMVIFDLSKYSENANLEWSKGTVNSGNIDSVEMLGLPFTHRSNIAARLAFVKQLLTFSATQILPE